MIHPGTAGAVAALTADLLRLALEAAEEGEEEAFLFRLNEGFDVVIGHADVALGVMVSGAGGD